MLYRKLRFLQSKNRSAKDASRRVRLIVAVGNTRLARRVSQATLFVPFVMRWIKVSGDVYLADFRLIFGTVQGKIKECSDTTNLK